MKQARVLLKSLVIIGAILGLLVASIGAFIPWLFPFIFISDLNVAQWLGRFLVFTSYHKFPFSN